jgi:Co/Zn/Cd efflux system component
MVNAVLHATGGLGQAWILNAFDPAALLSGTTALITLIFIIVFVVLASVLLLFYISRLIILAFGAVISPLVCLIALIPSMSDFAGNLAKAYFITIFTVFIHVVIIQLASAFLTMPDQVGANPVISILIGVALFSILLKSTATAIQLALASGTTNSMKKLGGQIINVITSSNVKNTTSASAGATAVKRARVR